MTDQVVICCAEEDEPTLAPLLAVLVERGYAPELVAGLDHEPMSLGDVMDLQSGPTLYVMCQSEAFNQRTIRRAEGMFGARKGPGDRILTLPTRGVAPGRLVKKIVDELGRPQEQAGATGEGGNHLREVVNVKALEGEPKAAPPEPAQPRFAAPRAAAEVPKREAPAPTPAAPPQEGPTAAELGRPEELGSDVVSGEIHVGEVAPPGRTKSPRARLLDLDAEADAAAAASHNTDGRGEVTAAPPSPSEIRHITGGHSSLNQSPAPGKRSIWGIAMWASVLVAAALTAWVVTRTSDDPLGVFDSRGAPGVAPLTSRGCRGRDLRGDRAPNR